MAGSAAALTVTWVPAFAGMSGLVGVALAAALFAAPAAAQSPPLRSDLPLWSGGGPDVYPEHFSDADGNFGCASIVRAGLWRWIEADGETTEWLRLRNRGAIHCAFDLTRGTAETGFETGVGETAFLAKIGETRIGAQTSELFALQLGFRRGSDYVLLAAPRTREVRLRFTVLDHACRPTRRLREPADIWRSDYCVVRTRAALLALAQAAALRAPAATLEFVLAVPESEE